MHTRFWLVTDLPAIAPTSLTEPSRELGCCGCCCRYPSFVDAVRDLDDPLTMVHLFATLPAEKLHGIPSKIVHTSRRLALEWQVRPLEPSHLGALRI